ncbi:uncharacterized protein LOC125756167 [Rhipicephalus sanguineus]|uniref:uncharacterized protein LOC125756167 n=1 Tax=Rhipicephalus sanguineus TaxID=34632 RepID=UPI0020C20817|nr:uncharacterized protein LOC125756167 [Rhipicephalus sanguineus]
MQSLLAVKEDKAAVAVKELFPAPQHGTSHVANSEFIGAASLGELTAAEPADYIDTSAGNVIAEFILDSSVDEALGLPQTLIYGTSHEHTEAAPVEVEGPPNEESVQTVAHAQVAPTGPFTEGLFNVVDGQASIHFFLPWCVCVCNTLC